MVNGKETSQEPIILKDIISDDSFNDRNVSDIIAIGEANRKLKLLEATNIISFLVVGSYLFFYFLILISLMFDSINDIDGLIIGDMKTIVLIIIGFYFGQKIVE